MHFSSVRSVNICKSNPSFLNFKNYNEICLILYLKNICNNRFVREWRERRKINIMRYKII